jgi:dTDP-4-amino-4,6-dideoxygalactose transaminase
MDQVRVSAPRVEQAEIDEVIRTLRSGMFAAGPLVTRLELAVAGAVGAAHAVAVSSGTAALHCAMHALGLGSDDEVITSPFTFVGTVNPALMQGAKLRFVDISLDDFNLDATQLEAARTARTAAVVAVDLYGQPVDAAAVRAATSSPRIPVVEDACQSLGGWYGDQAAGSLFDIGCFSLYATKNVMCGEGGVLVTDDERIADAARRFRQHGMTGPYEYAELGYNYRMTDIHAAVAVHQLERLEAVTGRRAANARVLSDGLADVPGLVLPHEEPGRRHAWHQYVVRVTPEFGMSRDATLDALRELGVHAAVYYPKLLTDYLHVAERTVGSTHLPNAERAAQEVLALPVHPDLSDSQLHQVVDAVRKVSGG